MNEPPEVWAGLRGVTSHEFRTLTASEPMEQIVLSLPKTRIANQIRLAVLVSMSGKVGVAGLAFTTIARSLNEAVSGIAIVTEAIGVVAASAEGLENNVGDAEDARVFIGGVANDLRLLVGSGR